MRQYAFRSMLAPVAFLIFSCLAAAQAAPQSGVSQSDATPFSHRLDGVWVTKAGPDSGAPVVDPMAHPPFTPWGQKRFDATFPSLGPRDVPGKENDPVLKCDPDGIPKILTSPEPFEIFTVPGRVLMTFEKDHDWRQIWTDDRKLPQDQEPTWNGYSIGRWEGNTFVVESAGFNDIPWLDYFGDPHSESLHLTEYYKRVDQNTLSLSITIDDPKAYTATWVGKPKLFTLKPDWEIIEYFCTIDDTLQYDKDLRLKTAGAAAAKTKKAPPKK